MTCALVTIPDVLADHDAGLDWVPKAAILLTCPTATLNAYYQNVIGGGVSGSGGDGRIMVGASDLFDRQIGFGSGSAHWTYFLTYDAGGSHLAGADLVDIASTQMGNSVAASPADVGRYDFVCPYDSGYRNVFSAQNIVSGQASALLLGNYAEVKVDVIELNGSTGPQAITDVGFQPDAVLFLGCTSGGKQGSNMMFGAADASLNQWVGATKSRVTSAANSSNRRSLFYDDCCIAHIGTSQASEPTTAAQQAQLTSMDANGFTLDLIQAGLDSSGNPMLVGYIAVKVLSGDGISVGVGVQGDTSINAGFAPDAVIFASAQAATSGADTPDCNYGHGIVGDYDGSTEENFNYWCGGSIAYTSTNSVLRMTSNSQVLFAKAAATRTGTGANLTWTTNDGGARLFGWVAFQIDTDDRVLDVTTLPATNVDGSTSTLNGTITPNTDPGVDVSYYFEYGPTVSYGSATTEFVAGDGSSPIAVSAVIPTVCNETVHFRVVAVNQYDCPIPGEDEEFSVDCFLPQIYRYGA